MAKVAQSLQILYCYARKDSNLRDELEEHLEPILRSGIAITWYDRKILAGEDWQHAIHSHIDQADFILLLISSSFMKSDYCYGIELQRALERHEWGLASVIPIILRPTNWQHTPIGRLQALPRNGKPVVLWRSRDEAFTQIAEEIRILILQRLSEDRDKKEYWMRLGHTHLHNKHYIQALQAYQQASQFDPNNALLHCRIGEILAELGMYNEALTVFELSLRLVSDNVTALQGRANMLLHLQRYEEAFTCYQSILNRFQATPAILCGNGHSLFAMGHYEEALAAYQRAITMFPEAAYPYHYKSIVLIHLGQYKEALLACEKSIDRDPRESSFHLNKARILEKLVHDQQKEPFEPEIKISEIIIESELNSDSFIKALVESDLRHEITRHEVIISPDKLNKRRKWINHSSSRKRIDRHEEITQTINDLKRLPDILDSPSSAANLEQPPSLSVSSSSKSTKTPFSLEDKIVMHDIDGTLCIYDSNGELLWRYKRL